MVFPCPGQPSKARILAGGLWLPAVLGRAGTTWLKREGDGATPCGRHRLLALIVRPDRAIGLASRVSTFPVRAMKPDDGWCENPKSGRYNRPVHLAGRDDGDTDRMWRDDRLYDAVGVFDWNIRPRVAGRGSAIFLHLTRMSGTPTAGCIALEPRHLRRLLERTGKNSEFFIRARPAKGPYRR